MDIDELRRLAAKTGLSLNYIAKDEMISKALLAIQGNAKLILKGGTAINRVYINNKRFSEDIDCDLIFNGSVKQAIIETDKITNKILEFEVAPPRIMKDVIRYDLFYTNPLNHKDKIRLEFKIINKSLGFDPTVVNFGFTPIQSPLLNVYHPDVLIKHKIECIINRTEGKDYIDLYYLLDIPHKPIIISREQKKKILKQLHPEKSELNAIANTINHYIPKSQRPPWELFMQDLAEKIKKKL